MRECDLLVVTAQRLYDKWADFNRTMVLARNGVDYGFFAERAVPNSLLDGMRRPIIGYYGAIAILMARIDTPFIAVPDPHSAAGAQDQLNKVFPKLYRFGTPGYRLVYQNSTWRLFARLATRAVSND